MSAQSALAGQFRPYLLRRAVDIVLLQITHLRVVLGHEEGFAIRIQPRPSRPARHLAVLDHRYGDHSRAVLIPPVALDQHPARGQVQAGSQGRSAGDDLDPVLPETLLNQPALIGQEACMMKCNASGDT